MGGGIKGAGQGRVLEEGAAKGVVRIGPKLRLQEGYHIPFDSSQGQLYGGGNQRGGPKEGSRRRGG